MRRKIIFLAALIAALGALTLAAVSKNGSATEKVIRVKAKKFEFNPSEIVVKKGELIMLELTSEDITHGFKLPDLGVRTEVKPGTVSHLRITPDKTGKFSFTCDVFCGSGHEDMSGIFVVTD